MTSPASCVWSAITPIGAWESGRSSARAGDGASVVEASSRAARCVVRMEVSCPVGRTGGSERVRRQGGWWMVQAGRGGARNGGRSRSAGRGAIAGSLEVPATASRSRVGAAKTGGALSSGGVASAVNAQGCRSVDGAAGSWRVGSVPPVRIPAGVQMVIAIPPAPLGMKPAGTSSRTASASAASTGSKRRRRDAPLTVSAPARRPRSRRTRAPPSCPPSRLRRISPAAERVGIWGRRCLPAARAGSPGRCRAR